MVLTSALNRKLLPALLFLLAGLAGCATRRPALDTQIVVVGGSSIEVQMAATLPVNRAVIAEWVRRAAEAVQVYLGHFPVKHLRVDVLAGGTEPIGEGVAHGASSIQVRLGPTASAADLKHDWVMTHEMFHLAFPTLDRRYLWMMEGLSDYLEPVARAQAGQWPAKAAWREFVEGLPQGLPEPGEDGLDGTTRRERIYWGGNIYWLLVDVCIRERTDNQRGLEDAIRAILRAGGNGDARWPLERVLTLGDQATGTTCLKDWYEKLGVRRGDVDLDALWKKLGVRYAAGTVTFDATAPWAKYREAITQRATKSPNEQRRGRAMSHRASCATLHHG